MKIYNSQINLHIVYDISNLNKWAHTAPKGYSIVSFANAQTCQLGISRAREENIDYLHDQKLLANFEEYSYPAVKMLCECFVL